jgi:hypothetical protein
MTDTGALLKLAEAEGVKRFPPKDPGDMGVDLNKWSRECFVGGFIAARQAALQGSARVTTPTLESLLTEYARDLRRNSSGADLSPDELRNNEYLADYLEELIARSK